MPKSIPKSRGVERESLQRCDHCPIRSLTLYGQPDGRLSDAILKLRKGTRTVRARRFVTRPGEVSDEVYSVFSGWGALLKIGAEGRRSIVAFMVASDFIGLPLLVPQMATHGVQAVSDMELCVFDRMALAAFIRAHPPLVDRLETWHFLNLQQAFARGEDAGRRSAQERVAHLLLELYRRLERLGLLHGDTMVTPLRQRDLADALGLTAVHVSRVLTSLKEDGAIDGSLSALRILDRRQLRGLAGLTTDSAEFPHFWLPGVDDLRRPSPAGRPSPRR